MASTLSSTCLLSRHCPLAPCHGLPPSPLVFSSWEVQTACLSLLSCMCSSKILEPVLHVVSLPGGLPTHVLTARGLPSRSQELFVTHVTKNQFLSLGERGTGCNPCSQVLESRAALPGGTPCVSSMGYGSNLHGPIDRHKTDELAVLSKQGMFTCTNH